MSGEILILNIAGGVALLLWGTRLVRTGILRAFGTEVRRTLGRSLGARPTAFLTGLGTAGLLQSSTATALLMVSFAGRGLVATAPALAVMLGADVGSTLVVQVLSFDVSWVSPVLILVGVVSFLASQARRVRQIGRVLIGLGLMLLSLQLIVGASEPLRESAVLQDLLVPLSEAPVLAVILAALLTWLAHSSVTVVLFVMSLAVTGVLPLTLGFALVLGANLGSGIVPVALTFGGTPEGRRIPLGNLAFRLVGALAALPALGFVAEPLAALGADPARQIANFHTAFNLALAAVFLPLVPAVARIADRILPESREGEDLSKPRYLDPTAVDTPPVAIAAATREVLRMADIVETMLRNVIRVYETDDPKLADEVSGQDDSVDDLYEAIKLYLTQVSRNALDESDSRRCIDLITFTTNLEHIGDIIDKNLIDLARKKIRDQVSFSEEGWRELVELHERVLDQMKLSIGVFVSGDVATARELIAEKDRFRDLERQAGEHHLARLRSGRIETIQSSALHLDILRDLKRVNSHLSSVAYPILERSGELRPTRLKAGQEV